MKNFIPQSIKNIYHLTEAILANIWYGFPSRKLRVIGVTGTNGKTTTVQMINSILETAGYKTAMISTINFKIGEKIWTNATKYTTLSAFATQKFIRQVAEEECDYLILETSSHALDQNRVWGIDYAVVAITNVTREHLDYHRTMEKYRRAKLRLFEMAKNTAVINLDMEKPEEYLDGTKAENIYGYTLKNPEEKIEAQNYPSRLKIIQAEKVELGIRGTQFAIQGTDFILNLPGEFNVENALLAIGVGLAEKISLENCAKALEKIKGVPGRFENIPNERKINIIIDYAVTPDSLRKLYSLIKELNVLNKKIIAVFGSCGERDRGKRPIMGRIVAGSADYVIVTNEDPYGEDPVQIINEIFIGVTRKKAEEQISDYQEINSILQDKNPKVEGKNCWRILDRKEAIKKALALAEPGDFVVVTGKGAEETMAVGNWRILWNDKKVIQEVLQER